jgi:hypothetical protein
MAERHKSKPSEPEEKPVSAVPDAEEFSSQTDQEEAAVVVATARSIPRPATSLGSRLKGDVGKVTVTLLGDSGSFPALEDVQKINGRADTKVRTPVMTVIQAVLAEGSGTMKVADLAEKVRVHWNRPFPSTPYTPQEFVYLMVRNANNMSVSE